MGNTSSTRQGVVTNPWWAPKYGVPGSLQHKAFEGMPGSVTYRCVHVRNHTDVRSGGIVAGNFALDKRDYAQGATSGHRPTDVKIYWIPLHLVADMPGLVVQATKLSDDRAVARSYRQANIAANSGGVFYPSSTPIPSAGAWKLEATIGQDHGCFVVTFAAEE